MELPGTMARLDSYQISVLAVYKLLVSGLDPFESVEGPEETVGGEVSLKAVTCRIWFCRKTGKTDFRALASTRHLRGKVDLLMAVGD